jgi:hypothetical protein
MQRIFWNITAVFFTLFILTFEFDYSIIPSIYEWTNLIFESLVYTSGTLFFGLENGFYLTISSDSIGLYVHVFNLFLIAIGIVSFIEIIFINKEVNLRLCILKILTYYLSLQLLIYGLDKVFKAQFFLPEPNTLFTPLKDISKDLLYWSTIGVSRSYSLFLGIAEVTIALFLLFRKTRLVGIILGIGIMINVVAVNFSFDISVKIYSLFLLSGFIVLASPYFGFFHQVFIQQKPAIFPLEKESFFSTKPRLKKTLKWALILLFITEGLFPFVGTQNFNDDTYPRPKFHGAYEVINSESEIENVFVHRKGYLIFKNERDEFQDFQLEVDSVNNQFLLFDYENKTHSKLKYQEQIDQLISITGEINSQEVTFQLKKINLENSALLQTNFHWTTE